MRTGLRHRRVTDGPGLAFAQVFPPRPNKMWETFHIVAYESYEKPGQYGDAQQTVQRFTDLEGAHAATVSKLLAPETIALVRFAPVKFVRSMLHCPKFAFSKFAPVKSASSKFAPNNETPDKFAPEKFARFKDPFVKNVSVKSCPW